MEYSINEDVKNIPERVLLDMYKNILKIRLFEDKIVELYRSEQEMQCPVHLCIGQEAVSAGVSACLTKGDKVFSNHRGHGHYIAKGGSLKKLAAELYGKKTGCSKGKGGSMHIVDLEVGFQGTSSIVSGSIPIAVGAALAFKMQNKSNVALVYFGDGAADEGVMHESLNFAALKKLPVIFVCENNFYATTSPDSNRKPLDNTAERAAIFGIPWKKIDGNNVLVVYKATKEAVERAKKGKGPSFIEARTYRWHSHVGPDDDTQWGLRSKEELQKWMKKCPLKTYEKFLLGKRILTPKDVSKTKKEIQEKVDRAFAFGKSSKYPDKEEIYDDLLK